jgi:D-alanyl-D-alanine carboxypeptidase
MAPLLGLIIVLSVAVFSPARAAPYAAMVMDARTGEVLHSRNADTRLHPASLTKMMTLYIAFEAVRLGEIDLDTQVRISANAPQSRRRNSVCARARRSGSATSSAPPRSGRPTTRPRRSPRRSRAPRPPSPGA